MLGRSGTQYSDYREPKHHPSCSNRTVNRLLNLANKESFGFLLTQRQPAAPLDHRCKTTGQQAGAAWFGAAWFVERHFAATPPPCATFEARQDVRAQAASANHWAHRAWQRRRQFMPNAKPERTSHVTDQATLVQQGDRASASILTHVDLTWIEKKHEDWIRFGKTCDDKIVDRRRLTVSFASGRVFAFVRWQANDFGTIRSNIDIIRAVGAGEAYSTLPCVRVGGERLLAIHGWPKVLQVLRAIDAVEALGIDASDAAPDHWRHVHNRLCAGQAPRAYTLARHKAWLARQVVMA